MSYTPPLGGEVRFEYDGIYAPPSGGDVVFALELTTIPAVYGSSVAALTLSCEGSGAAFIRVDGSGAGALKLSAAAAGSHPPLVSGDAAAAFEISGVAVGETHEQIIVSGFGAASLLSACAAGVFGVTGQGSAGISLDGHGAGARGSVLSGRVALGLSAHGTGGVGRQGDGDGVIAMYGVGSAEHKRPVFGQGAPTLELFATGYGFLTVEYAEVGLCFVTTRAHRMEVRT